MLRLLLVLSIFVVPLQAESLDDFVAGAPAKGTLAEGIEDFSGYCSGPVLSSNEHQDSPQWSGACIIKRSDDGFRIQVNMVGPVQENYHGRTATTVKFRDNRNSTPVVWIAFENWIGLLIIPSSQEARDDIV